MTLLSWIIFYLAATECESDMKRKVDWDDEENDESKMELSEETSETEASNEEDSSDEESRIKDVLENLSQTVSRKRASDLLHSMAASKDILFWTPRWQLLGNKSIISVTNIAELVEYILLPHNDDVIKPRALKSTGPPFQTLNYYTSLTAPHAKTNHVIAFKHIKPSFAISIYGVD